MAAAGKHQVLIFVHSRKETVKTAKFLKEEALKDDKLARFMGVKPRSPSPFPCTNACPLQLQALQSGEVCKC